MIHQMKAETSIDKASVFVSVVFRARRVDTAPALRDSSCPAIPPRPLVKPRDAGFITLADIYFQRPGAIVCALDTQLVGMGFTVHRRGIHRRTRAALDIFAGRIWRTPCLVA